MKKFLCFAVITLFMSMFSFSQRVEKEVFEVDKQQVNGYSITFTDYSAAEIGAAMTNRLEKKAGLKSSKVKGFMAYIMQKFPDFGNDNYDIYTKTEAIGKKQNEVAKVLFGVTRGNMNAVDDATNEKVEAFINDFVVFAIKDCNEARMLKYNEELKKEMKEYDKMADTKAKLTQQLDDTEKALVKSKEKIDQLQANIEKLKSTIY
jgi:archaellum component FlaC